ncbi:MBL fold metallo-hydrolase [Halocalculus aciditolerans]|nr:MBL fold metallo-hydrolase [Halocalculus aciditolerans]
MEFTEGVYDLPVTLETDDGERVFHPSAVELEDGGLLLVDAGFGHTLDQLEANLDGHGFGLADVEFVLLTHQDGDHVGGLAPLVDRVPDVTVFAHRDDAPAIDGREAPIKGQGDRYPAVPVDVELAGGETFRTAAGPLDVVATPGHTPGHVSLHLPERDVLLAGDALTADDTGLRGPKEHFTPKLSQAIDSVRALADRDPETTLAYHGGLVEHGHGRVADLHDELDADLD